MLSIYLEQITDYKNGFCFHKRTNDHSLEYWRGVNELGLYNDVTGEDWRYFHQFLRSIDYGQRITIYAMDDNND